MQDNVSYTTLEQWLENQGLIIRKTTGIINIAIELCQESNFQANIPTLEILSSNICMHIEQIAYYDTSISTFIANSTTLPDNLDLLHTYNNQQIEKLQSRFTQFQDLMQSQLQSLEQTLHYTQSFLAQLKPV